MGCLICRAGRDETVPYARLLITKIFHRLENLGVGPSISLYVLSSSKMGRGT
jgi:hypothetical protein